jgi:hypothetical protein
MLALVVMGFVCSAAHVPTFKALLIGARYDFFPFFCYNVIFVTHFISHHCLLVSIKTCLFSRSSYEIQHKIAKRQDGEKGLWWARQLFSS